MIMLDDSLFMLLTHTSLVTLFAHPCYYIINRPVPLRITMGFCSKLDLRLFPEDFSLVNHRGDWCLTTKKSYTLFRVLILFVYAVDFAYCAWFFQKKDLLYFTNWGLILTMLCALVLLVQNLINWKYQGKTKIKYWKVSHFLFTLIFVFEMFITGVYWCGIFPYAVIHLWGDLGVYDIVNPIMAHGVPVLLLFIDLQFNLITIWNSAYIPCYYVLLGVYLIVNCIYTLRVDTIYAILTYQSWVSFFFILACAVVIVICHVLARLYCKHCKQERVLRILDGEEIKVSLFSEPPKFSSFYDPASDNFSGDYQSML